MWSARTLKAQNSKKIYAIDLRRGSDHWIPCLEWTWAHECVPHASEPRRQVRVVGPNNIVKSDVDPPKRSMCHRGGG
jgi:hypothetical protein